MPDHEPRERDEGAGHIDRLVGLSGPETDSKLSGLVRSGGEVPRLEMAGEKIDVREANKTERDQAIIRLAADAADRLMRACGREKTVDIPDENLHLVEATGPIGGFFDARKQQLAVVKKPGQDASLAADLFHELVHAKSYNALKVQGSDGQDIAYYRTGLETVARDGRTHFRELNEAVVQTLTMRFYDQTVARDPMFSDEIRLSQHRGDDPREREEGSYWVAKQHFQALVGAIMDADRSRSAAGSAGEFRGQEEVEDMFFRASVTGDLLGIARVVEGIWGKGSFRKLGQSLDDFCRENIYKRKAAGGLVDGLMERAKRPIRSIRKKCSSLINDDSTLINSLFRGLKTGLKG